MVSADDIIADAADVEAVVKASQRPLSITDLISTYGILPTLASWMSATLQRQSLCDGRSLLKRQALCSPYKSIPTAGLSCDTPEEYGDKEIEVYLYNFKCDAAGALPCVRCGINV